MVEKYAFRGRFEYLAGSVLVIEQLAIFGLGFVYLREFARGPSEEESPSEEIDGFCG